MGKSVVDMVDVRGKKDRFESGPPCQSLLSASGDGSRSGLGMNFSVRRRCGLLPPRLDCAVSILCILCALPS